MNINKSLLLLLLLPSLAFAKFAPNQKVKLLGPLQEGENIGVIENMIEDEALAKKVYLKGKARIVKTDAGSIVQMVWTGVQKVDKKDAQVSFKEPMISTFKINGTRQEGLLLSIEGEPAIVNSAINDLMQGKVDKDDLKKKRTAKNPSKKARVVDVEEEPSQAKKSQIKAASDKKNTSEENNPSSSQQATDKKGMSEAATRKESKSSSSNFSSQGYGTYESGLNGFGKDSIDIDKSKRKKKKEMAQNTDLKSANFKVVENKKSCSPLIDKNQNRVIIRSRSETYEGEKLVKTGECTNTFESYPIRKDYDCQNCQDLVNLEEGKAYSKYQEYWLNADGKRQNISEEIFVDNSKHYSIVEKTGDCLPLVNIEERLAFPQVETFYLNLHNEKKVVQGCHKDEKDKAIPINATSKGCGLVHDFPNNISFEQKRLVFTYKGVEHQALGCHSPENSIAHEFTEVGCQKVIDYIRNIVTPMYRRKITTSFGSKIITHECEPGIEHTLLSTTDNCENQYVHDFDMGRSYIKKRYYVENSGREYVSGCVRTNDYLEHQFESNNTWKHDDEKRVSIPFLSIYIQPLNGEKRVLDEPKIRGERGAVEYTLEKIDTRPTSSYFYEGCFRRTPTQLFNLYKRPDESLYEVLMGEGSPIASTVNECVTKDEENRGYDSIGRPLYETRTVTVNPHGTVVHATPWTKKDERVAPAPEWEGGRGSNW